ncbi:DUF7344 domain-containing protein [Natronococcus wangiae]|uniref:DUF7344 domain-containing protein n=1 Tax=Natronococcus wangiae TaxID=3068275 RepID=UPI00273D5EB1|nr:hypothetical protein [Natronococcus sp. AD5]
MAGTESAKLSPETVRRILSDPCRRRLLSRLNPGERTTVDEVIGLVARERERTLSAVDRAARRRIEISLVHNHLPRLADYGVITYAPQESSVVLTNDRDTLRPLEDHLERTTLDS